MPSRDAALAPGGGGPDAVAVPTASPRVRASVPVVVVVNARASSVPSPARCDRLVARLRDAGADVELERTSSLEELAAIWAREDGRRMVLVGGDGSVHAVAALPGPARDIALIPAGRANNVARSLRIPVDHDAAAALAVAGEVRPIDLVEARAPSGRHVVVEGVSAGFLALARTRYHARNSADLRAALRAGAGVLGDFRPFAVHLAGGVPGSEDLVLAQVFVANLPLYAFGLHVAPHALPADGVLDLVGVAADHRRDVLRMLLDLRRDTHYDDERVHLWRSRSITLQTGGVSPIVADSVDLGPGPVALSVLPRALRIVRP